MASDATVWLDTGPPMGSLSLRARRQQSCRVDASMSSPLTRHITLGLAGIQYPKMLNDVQTRMVIGLTATPWRTAVGNSDDSPVESLFPDAGERRCATLTLADPPKQSSWLEPLGTTNLGKRWYSR